MELGSGLSNLELHTTSQEMNYKENECMINISKECLSHLTFRKTINNYEYTTAWVMTVEGRSPNWQLARQF